MYIKKTGKCKNIYFRFGLVNTIITFFVLNFCCILGLNLECMLIEFAAMPLKSDPWQHLPPPPNLFWTDAIERCANAVGMSILPQQPLRAEIKSKAQDRSPIKLFLYWTGIMLPRVSFYGRLLNLLYFLDLH